MAVFSHLSLLLLIGIYNCDAGSVINATQLASASASQTLEAAANAASVYDTIQDARKNKRLPGRRNLHNLVRRSTSIENFKDSATKVSQVARNYLLTAVPTLTAKLVHALSDKSNIPGTWRDFTYTKTRYPIANTYAFHSLSASLSESFQNLVSNKDNPFYPGDIISCRLLSTDFAEHYMMIINESIALEVGVANGKDLTKMGKILVTPITDSSYKTSKECLYHKNTVIDKALENDERKEKNQRLKRYDEYALKSGEIMGRVEATAKAKDDMLNYKLLSCNCQDLVLYWAYGYVQNKPCIEQFFSDKKIIHQYSAEQLETYLLGEITPERARQLLRDRSLSASALSDLLIKYPAILDQLGSASERYELFKKIKRGE